jgi:hypothetical protein
MSDMSSTDNSQKFLTADDSVSQLELKLAGALTADDSVCQLELAFYRDQAQFWNEMVKGDSDEQMALAIPPPSENLGSEELFQEVRLLRNNIADRLAHIQQHQDHHQHADADADADAGAGKLWEKEVEKQDNLNDPKAIVQSALSDGHHTQDAHLSRLQAQVTKLQSERVRLEHMLVCAEAAELKQNSATATRQDAEAHEVVDELCEQLLQERVERLRCLEIVRALCQSLSPRDREGDPCEHSGNEDGQDAAAHFAAWDAALARARSVLQDACDEWDRARGEVEEGSGSEGAGGGKDAVDRRRPLDSAGRGLGCGWGHALGGVSGWGGAFSCTLLEQVEEEARCGEVARALARANKLEHALLAARQRADATDARLRASEEAQVLSLLALPAHKYKC